MAAAMRRNVVGTNFTSQAVRNPTSCPTRAAAPVPRRGAVRAAAKASDRIQLGTSDLQVSVCCLGTMTWGQQNTEAEAHAQLNAAWEAGINFLDTAEMYPVPPTAQTQGATDRYIGSWLKDKKREDVVLATKVSGYSERNTWVRDPPAVCRVNRDQIVQSVDRSLQRLQTDTIDLLQIHWPDRYVPLFGAGAYDKSLERPDDVPFDEQLRGLEEVVKAGKVRYIGVSNETSYGISQFAAASAAAGLPRVQTIQNAYSLLCRVPYETDLAETCRRHDVSLLAYSPLAGGALSGKYIGENPAGARFNLFPGYMARYNASLAKDAVADYVQIARKYGMTPSQLALAWCRSRWFVASTIIGATSVGQLAENLKAFELTLTKECLDDIAAVYKRYRDPAIL